MPKRIDLTGQTYGYLKVVKRIKKPKSRRSFWLCRCSCGKETEVVLSNLRDGHTKSCGCYRKQKIKENFSTHGLSRHPLYGIWSRMKTRCENHRNFKYSDYGARGIGLCPQWEHDPEAFVAWGLLNGFEEWLEIDRINNDKGYCPENCRFVTKKINSQNKRLLQRNNTIGFRGVSISKDGKYVSQVQINGHIHRLGTFLTAVSAAIARDMFVISMNNNFLPLNFPALKGGPLAGNQIESNKQYA